MAYINGNKIMNIDVTLNDGDFDAGKKAEYDAFWDNFQLNGTRDIYQCAFWYWSSDCFYPKYDIVLRSSNGESMFRYLDYAKYQKGENVYFDLAQRLEECGVVLDISKATQTSYMFSYAYNIIRVPELSFVSSTSASNMFQNCRRLKTIDKLILPSKENTLGFNNAFLYCNELENITFEGLICSDLDFVYSPLTKDSMNNIIQHLKDYSAEGGTHTVTFKADRESMLTAEEKAVATNKGWTLLWN